MFKSMLPLLGVCVISSCATYQQIATVSSSQFKMSEGGNFCYDSAEVTIDYDFWAEFGRVGFMLTNHTDEDMYVNLEKSFLVVNGRTFDYYLARTWSSDVSGMITKTAESGAAATFSRTSEFLPYDLEAVSVTGSGVEKKSKSAAVRRGVEFAEKKGVWIPAGSSRVIEEYPLMDTPYRKCGFVRNPRSSESSYLSFSEEKSPYKFDNVLTLTIRGTETRIVNSFYISEFMNMKERDAVDVLDKRNCGQKTGEKERISKYRAADKFFINYWPRPRYSDSDR